MIDRIYEYMTRHRMTEPGGAVLAAVSGGADSMCLLEALLELRERLGIRLRVLHVHHGLRESAEGDLIYVREYCEKAGITFEAVRVDASGYAARSGLSVEEAARHLRYEALERTARKWDEKCAIAVAHHLEDQAETVLFNLVRGSRLTGLRGMLPVNGRIIRPLMECSRKEIEDFLTERGISWREDETNEDIRYSRNLIRREVMPMLERLNSGAQEHIARAAEEAAETEEFLGAETERVLSACRLPENAPGECVLDISALMGQPPIMRRRAVYATAAGTAGTKKDLQDVNIRAVLDLARKQGNGMLCLPAGVRVEKQYGKLIFKRIPAGRNAAEESGAHDNRWPMGAGEYSCRVLSFDGDLSAVPRKQYTKWLDYDKIGAFPELRTRRTGDRITLDESGKTKTIARYMIDAKVPGSLRDRIVLPAADSEILWIPDGRDNAAAGDAGKTATGGRISAAFKVREDTKRVLEIRWEPEKR